MAKSYESVAELFALKKRDGLYGNGASDDDIARAEQALNLTFPPSYRNFLRDYGWGYFGHLEVICGLGADIPEEWSPGIDLLKIVPTERQGVLALSDHFLPFCQNGAGDWYALNCLNTSDAYGNVLFLSHEATAESGLQPETVAAGFSDWFYDQISGSFTG